MKRKYSVLMSVYYKENPIFLKKSLNSMINQTMRLFLQWKVAIYERICPGIKKDQALLRRRRGRRSDDAFIPRSYRTCFMRPRKRTGALSGNWTICRAEPRGKSCSHICPRRLKSRTAPIS